MSKKFHKYALISILVVSAILRIWNLGLGDPINDEVLIAFRALGLIDFDAAEFQTTPFEWFDIANGTISHSGIPSWAKFSFHDHPPFAFWIQHIFLTIFGTAVWAFRLPSALFGIASVYLLYKLGKSLFNKNIGLLSALFIGITVNHVHMSRVGMQEAYVIFFIILTAYLYTLSINKNPKWFIAAGISMGFAFLTKYTAFLLIPWLIIHLAISKPRLFKNKNLWIGILLSITVFSPVILYNLALYNATGHFDFQFSYLFGQHPEVWQKAPGKEIGSVGNRFSNFFAWIKDINSLPYLILGFLSFLWIGFECVKKNKRAPKEKLFILLGALITFLYIIFITGPAYRFLSMLTPFFAIFIALGIEKLQTLIKKEFLFKGILGIFIAFELLNTANSQLLAYPKESNILFTTKIRDDKYSWGYNELETFLKTELQETYPAVIFNKKYAFLENLQKIGVTRAKVKNYKSYPALFIYDHDIFNFAQLWSYDRRFMYEGWPFIPTEEYYKLLEQYGQDYLKKSGFHNYYFIIPTKALELRRMTPITTLGPALEDELISQGKEPIEIKDPKGDTVFHVYKWSD
ncbi:MAG: hypothetical protein COU07_00805 [Candidatus Harrisonbacteria bacterium CG10_big_fil_rev_8_21_14_0_10_40_38]|uniref:Glycosyltransferase RgtA/B/C/D-like domain-containing protein n=1 Tax=Candidatus Harrisonbacteria bacterium CG10_big_fil_rev_8_21_14_0_10_40_38 TaxID=1974583 RepID=A0A2H0UUJ0_9BACT|nr:MAG: hypothetical protein COU07_00805 [Candidatus Harrisonbacteria bacterium CG10_big_fil_rev_8_21_14_0_10_40_38]